MNWGFAKGKTQTNLPWDFWKDPYVAERRPQVWFHEIFNANGEPYSKAEGDFIRKMSGARRMKMLKKAS